DNYLDLFLVFQPFKRFVEVGRVAYIAFGDDKGKLAVIVDVLDQNRALIDGPCSNVTRNSINFKALQLTPLKLKLGNSARTGTVVKAWKKEGIDKKWSETTWAQKLAKQEKKSKLSDFDRFKLMKAKQARNRVIKAEFGKLRKAARKAAKK
ncbi:60S ribosomal protein L14-like, partial [Haliotis rufescens]|uniref:60S ribosomal protein L14-like n=1 Tax=Haliotis rufescens TaxID=6454 RepID=UPI00201EC370